MAPVKSDNVKRIRWDYREKRVAILSTGLAENWRSGSVFFVSAMVYRRILLQIIDRCFHQVFRQLTSGWNSDIEGFISGIRLPFLLIPLYNFSLLKSVVLLY